MRPVGGCAGVYRDIGFVKVDVLRVVTPTAGNLSTFRRILLLPSMAVESSLTSAPFSQITRRLISDDSNILSHRHENYKSRPRLVVFCTMLSLSVCVAIDE
jgi:hypothetical protein